MASRRVADTDTVLHDVVELRQQEACLVNARDRGARLGRRPFPSSGARANNRDQRLSN